MIFSLVEAIAKCKGRATHFLSRQKHSNRYHFVTEIVAVWARPN